MRKRTCGENSTGKSRQKYSYIINKLTRLVHSKSLNDCDYYNNCIAQTYKFYFFEYPALPLPSAKQKKKTRLKLKHIMQFKIILFCLIEFNLMSFVYLYSSSFHS